MYEPSQLIERQLVENEADNIAVHRIEEASLNAWPAMRQMLLDGWVLRFSKGFTKRSNSIIPLYPPRGTTEVGTIANDEAYILDKIRYCENLYAREQLQTVFRLTSIDPATTANLSNLLSERGYREADPSLVLAAPLTHNEAAVQQVSFVPLEEWLNCYCQLTGMGEPTRTLHRLILQGITGDCGFAVLRENTAAVACGLAVVEHELVGLFDVFTSTQQRRLGRGQKLVEGMLAWGYAEGARTAYLQVVADNDPALKLYANMGFVEKYRYGYQIAP